jgi:glycosyltransferase involved in cell wall biosynthesis
MISRLMERLVVKLADKVILVTEWSRNAFLKRYPKQPHDKFMFIPNGCDLEEFAVLRSATGAPRNPRFMMLHAGTLTDAKHWARSSATLLQALHAIVKREPSIADKLSLAFTGFLPEAQQPLVRKLGLSTVVTELGFLPRAEFLRFMHACDLLVVINYERYATLIPGKLYEYWAVGGPPILLLSCPGAAASLVEQHSLGVTVDPSDVGGIQDAILTAYRRKSSGRPLRIKTDGIEPYDRRALTGQLAQLLSRLAAPQPASEGTV